MNVLGIVATLLGALCASAYATNIVLAKGNVKVLGVGKRGPPSGRPQRTLFRPHHYHPNPVPNPSPIFPQPIPVNPPKPIPIFPTPIPVNPPTPKPEPIPDPDPDTGLRCEDGSLPLDCSGVPFSVCDDAGCPAYPHAACDLDRCDGCRPKFFVENVAVCCDKCSSGYSPVSSPFGDPCLFSTCGPDEYCRPNYCTLPDSRQASYDCISNCRDSSGVLIGDGRREECFNDPCERFTCPINYHCSADLCSCSATCLPGPAPPPNPIPLPNPEPGYSGGGHVPVPGYSGGPVPVPVPVPAPGYSGGPVPVPVPVPAPAPVPGYSGHVPQPVVVPSPGYTQGKK